MDAYRARVINYFTQCHDDYRRFWRLDRHLSMHAGIYDQEHRNFGPAQDNSNRVLARLADIRPGDRVLDAGCGVGGSTLWLAANLGCRVVGVNIHAGQLADARRHASVRGVGDVTFLRRDFRDTGLSAGTFDVVWAIESICYAPEKLDFAREAYRLLKPGGRLAVMDGFLRRDCQTPDEASALGKWCDGWAVPNLATVAGFGSALTGAGFTGVRYTDLTPNVRRASRQMWWLSAPMYPFAKVLNWLGFLSDTRMGNIRAGYYQYRIGRSGLGCYGVFTARKPG